MELVSVIIPTYNRETKIVKRAIDSVLKQSYKNFEIIIIDDNRDNKISNNVTSLINKLNDSRIIYHKNKENIGGAKSRNKGIHIASGQYISFLDDDDIFLSEKLEKQVNYMKVNQVDFVISNLAIVDTQMKIKDIRKFNWLDKNQYSNTELLVNHYKYHLTGTPTFMFKKNMLINLNGFPSVEMGHEFHLVDRALKNGYRLGYVNEILTIAFLHDGERISTNQNRQKQLNNLLEFKLKNLKNLRKKDKYQIYHRHYVASTFDYLNNGHLLKSLKPIVLAFKYRPTSFLYQFLKIVTIKIYNKGVNLDDKE
ncbi:glycosyltransferase family 2 protein [Staphylococcus saprophyticus]|uniref:glycosyltransferase family 2 protein n=1 Tax=Staphylococcus saprophyticus TaxID=29385 RepID=UPI001887B37F|nr:glycosyltransferase family 2 protein [Staphylococcus saprophyticus]